MPRHEFSWRVQPFACRACGKRSTGRQGMETLELCPKCLTAAELENDHFDNGHDKPRKGCRQCEKEAAMHPAINPAAWQVSDQIKSIADDVIGTVIEVGYNAVKVQWEDGKTSHVGKRSNVAGRFEKVC